jgi:hypothetical protein
MNQLVIAGKVLRIDKAKNGLTIFILNPKGVLPIFVSNETLTQLANDDRSLKVNSFVGIKGYISPNTIEVEKISVFSIKETA